jgi:hypothetical protein
MHAYQALLHVVRYLCGGLVVEVTTVKPRAYFQNRARKVQNLAPFVIGC